MIPTFDRRMDDDKNNARTRRTSAGETKVPTSRDLRSKSFIATPPVSLFQGCDTVVTGSGLSTAVHGTFNTTGAQTSVLYHVTEDVESLYRALDMSQSISAGFLFGSGTEKSQFVQSLNLTMHSINIVVYSKNAKGTDTADNYRLRDDVSPPVDDEQLAEFFRSFGDSFVSSLTKGSEYYAVYTFYSQSREEQTSVMAQLAAAGIFKSGVISGDFQSKLAEVTKSSHTRIAFSQKHAGIASPNLPQANDLVAYALAFPSLPIDAPVILSFACTGYENVRAIQHFGPIAKNRRYFHGTTTRPGMVNSLLRVVELENQLLWIEELYEFYRGYSGDEDVKNGLMAAETDEEAIKKTIDDFVDEPTKILLPMSLDSLKRGAPILQYQITSVGPFGGDEGDPFDDVNINTYLQRKTRISALQLRSGGEVDQLITSYEEGVKDGNAWTTRHGGDGGNLSVQLPLVEGQFVTRIAGRFGHRVDKLEFKLSNGGRTLEGGGGDGTAFEWVASDADIVLGFSGRSSRRLENIQPVVARLQKAKWRK